MNYVQLYQAIQDYSENTEALFVNNIRRFVMEAEDRIYNTVQIPALRRNVTGTVTTSNPYLSAPDDYLSTYSLAAVEDYNTANANYIYLLNKDVNFIREAYPNPTDVGTPRYYALFGSQYSNANELSFLMAPTPDANYTMELHYFYYPISIVQGVATELNTLIGGTLYNNGYYTNVPLSGGSGLGLTANILVSGGAVTEVTIMDGGNFYVVGDVLTTSNTYLGGSGTGFSITVRTINNPEGTSWLGDNYDPALLYGAMREAMIFMKGEQDMVQYYEAKYGEAIAQLKRLGDGLERNDAYRRGQTSLPYNQL